MRGHSKSWNEIKCLKECLPLFLYPLLVSRQLDIIFNRYYVRRNQKVAICLQIVSRSNQCDHLQNACQPFVRTQSKNHDQCSLGGATCLSIIEECTSPVSLLVNLSYILLALRGQCASHEWPGKAPSIPNSRLKDPLILDYVIVYVH